MVCAPILCVMRVHIHTLPTIAFRNMDPEQNSPPERRRSIYPTSRDGYNETNMQRTVKDSVEVIPVDLIRHHHHPQQEYGPDDLERECGSPVRA